MRQTTLAAVIMTVVLSVFVFGVMTMNMADDGSTSSCPFMDQDMIVCPMSFADHIGIVQRIFNVVPKNTISIMPIYLLTILALFLASKLKIDLNESRRYFYTTTPPLLSFNKLLLALSDGRLQSKLYA